MKRILMIGLALALVACESNAERRHAFYVNCFAAKFNKAQCHILWRQAQNTRAADDSAMLAIGLSAGAKR